MPALTITSGASLRPFNSFGVEAIAEGMTELFSEEQLPELRSLAGQGPCLILGGGSNMLFTNDVPGLVVKVSLPGRKLIREDEEYAWIEAGAGENWHDLVLYCTGKGWHGIENLALIPGQAGTAPIQNIGAYGVEVSDVIEEVRFFDLLSGDSGSMSGADCRFGYRDSIFKHELKGRCIITAITMRLRKQSRPNTSYTALKQALDARGISNPTHEQVMEAVIAIRRSRLPDPAELGNAGSFFKNPVVDSATADMLKTEHPGIPSYHAPGGMVKLAAGWLIEMSGWKGRRLGNAGVHERQALVLVNLGGATGKEIAQLAGNIISDVKNRFGIELAPEVNII